MILFEEDPDFRLGYRWCAQVLRRGAYLGPYRNMFANAATTDADVTRTLEATGAAFKDLKKNRKSMEPPAQLARGGSGGGASGIVTGWGCWCTCRRGRARWSQGKLRMGGGAGAPGPGHHEDRP